MGASSRPLAARARFMLRRAQARRRAHAHGMGMRITNVLSVPEVSGALTQVVVLISARLWSLQVRCQSYIGTAQ